MCSRRPDEQTAGMDTRMALERRLELARARRDSQPSYSPDWDAAMSDIDEVTARLARLAILARAQHRISIPA